RTGRTSPNLGRQPDRPPLGVALTCEVGGPKGPVRTTFSRTWSSGGEHREVSDLLTLDRDRAPVPNPPAPRPPLSSKNLMKTSIPPKVVARVWALAIVPLLASTAGGDEPKRATGPGAGAQSYAPRIASASQEAERAIRAFRVPAGLKVELFAAEPLLANPVAFCIDEKGAAYVAETFRLNAGLPDHREHMNWLDEDLACRRVADRVAMYKKYLGSGFAKYEVEHERVRRVVDRDGDGRADAATVFADGFNDPAAGIGAGVLARKGDVWYACIPWLWKLRDNDGDGRADRRELLHQGYGVHVGFLGHDLHGLRFGPDGKLYFSIGDRGFNVTTLDNLRLAVPDTGSVLRCNPDGTELEVFATGLRNPQELAFDE